MDTLLRRKDSGLVPFPKHWPKRILSGSATYQTKCDMLVGPCSCLSVHFEYHEDTRHLLRHYNTRIEQLVLIPKRDGSILIPKYWLSSNYMPYGVHTHLLGKCRCGEIHTGTERWVQDLLKYHVAKFA